MKVGDLIKFEPDENTLYINDIDDKRRTGTILALDENKQYGTLVEVLWNTGSPGWILQSRVEVFSEGR